MGVCIKMNVFEAKQKQYVCKIVCSVDLLAEEGDGECGKGWKRRVMATVAKCGRAG